MGNQSWSADDVSDERSEEYLVELTHTADDERRTHLVIPIEAYRPSMLPLGGPPSYLFQPLGGGERLLVQLPDIVDIHPVQTDGSNPDILENALAALEDIVATEPRLLASETVSAAINDAVEQESSEQRSPSLEQANSTVTAHAAIIARRWVDGHGTRQDSCHDTSLDLINDQRIDKAVLVNGFIELADTESSNVATATELLSDIAASTPAAALDAIPQLTTIAAEADLVAQRYGFYALSCIASEYPEQVYPAVDVLTSGVESTDETVQTNATAAIGRIASGYPDIAAPLVADIAALVESDSKPVRGNAGGLLADIATYHPEEVVAYADELFELLGDSVHQTRIHASIALLRAGEANPEAVRSHHSQLHEALDDPTPEVRANVCTLIHNSDAPVPVERLHEVRENDRNEIVRSRAARAVEGRR